MAEAFRGATLRVLEGDEARLQLANADFLKAWQELARSCPWATAFQEPGFVMTWYDAYRESFGPLLVFDLASDGALTGLFTLAVDRAGRVIVAGGRQAEYQVWLARSGHEGTFPRAALEAIRPRLQLANLSLRYVPALTPLEWLKAPGPSGVSCRVVEASRPLMSIGNGAETAESFKKKSNKSRLNRLAKIGPVQFERFISAVQLRPFIASISAAYDLRQGSLGADPPFHSDRRKAEFHLDLLRTPDLLHATVLRAGDTFVAGHLGVIGNSSVHVGVLAHSPFLAAHSPGKLLMMFLAQQLAAEGISTLDLTPGGDGWKERFADRHDTVRHLSFSANGVGAIGVALSERAISVVGRGLRAVGVSPNDVRRQIESVRHRTIGEVFRSAGRQALARIRHTSELRAYVMELKRTASAERPHSADRDSIEDLILFRRSVGAPERQAFFQTALRRLEEGHHVYTRVQNGVLIHWGWMAEGQEKAVFEEVHQEFAYPPGSGVLYDFYMDPAARGQGLYRDAINQMIWDARLKGLERLFIFVLRDNLPSRHVIETSGFTYLGSLFERRVLTRSTKWRSGFEESPTVTP